MNTVVVLAVARPERNYHANASSFQVSDTGVLTVFRKDGQKLAAYAAGQWLRVVSELSEVEEK